MSNVFKQMSEVDEIKSKLDIIDVVQEYIQLKQAGTNFKANCPFHTEKTPSFMVSKERQIWHCFGCSEGGDIFTFVQKIENIDFREALKMLANKAGVKLSHHDPKMQDQKNRLLEACELAAKFWFKILEAHPGAEIARAYLKERGITDDIREEFQIGFAPESWDATNDFLKKKGFSENDIFLAGLTIKKDRGAGFYDRFRNRVIFPVKNTQGEVVGFGGRIMPGADEKLAKYINSPQTNIYNKSLIMYNFDKAKSEIKKKDRVVVVEGYMDVIASWKAGVKNTVATSGTALTRDQIALVKRYTNTIACAFDADSAGQNAAFRGIDLLLRSDVNIQVITIPYGKDPDDCVRKNPQDWASAAEHTQNFMEYIFSIAIKKYPGSSVEEKKNIGKMLLPFIGRIANGIEQAHWVHKLASYFNMSDDILREALNKTRQQAHENKIIVAKGNERKKISKTRNTLLEEMLLAIVLKFSQHLPWVIDQVSPDYIKDKDLNELYKKLIIYYTKYINPFAGEIFDFTKFYNYLDSEKAEGSNTFQDLSESLLLLADKDFAEYDAVGLKKELNNIISYLHSNNLRIQLQLIKNQLEAAENDKDLERIQKLSIEHGRIMDDLNSMGSIE